MDRSEDEAPGDAGKDVRTGLAETIGLIVTLAPFGDDGRRLHGACPFHPDVDRSLFVADETWHCFACASGGDAAAWATRVEAMTIGRSPKGRGPDVSG